MCDHKFTAIKNCPLFHGICEEDLIIMLECFAPKVYDYQPGETVIRCGNYHNELAIILQGKIIVSSKVYPEPITLLKSDVIDLAIPLSHNPVFPYTCIAHTPSTVLYIHANHIHTECACMCPSHRKFLTNIIFELSNQALRFQR